MFIAYIDTSARPYDNTENYVLASVITNEAQWQTIDNSIKQIKLIHFPDIPDDNVEIHAKDRIHKSLILK